MKTGGSETRTLSGKKKFFPPLVYRLHGSRPTVVGPWGGEGPK